MSNFEANRIPILLAASMLGSGIVGTVVVCLYISSMRAEAKQDTQAVADQVSSVAKDVAVIKTSNDNLGDGQKDLKDGQRALWEAVRTNTTTMNTINVTLAQHSEQLLEMQKAQDRNENNRREDASGHNEPRQ